MSKKQINFWIVVVALGSILALIELYRTGSYYVMAIIIVLYLTSEQLKKEKPKNDR